jgi:DNA-binding IclR family transcriptional regulator
MARVAKTPVQGTQSIRRALEALRSIAAGRESGITFADVTRLTGLTRPTAHRMLSLLVEEGLVEHKSRTGRYVIGEQIVYLSYARRGIPHLVQSASEHLAEAARALGDSVFLTVKAGDDTLCVARQLGSYPIQVLSVEIGSRRPLGAVSAGLAILSTMPEQTAREIVKRNEIGLRAFNVRLPELLIDIKTTRQFGYSVRRNGIVPGTVAISSPLRRNGEAIAAVTAVGIKRRLPRERTPEIVAILQRCTADIEASLSRRAV